MKIRSISIEKRKKIYGYFFVAPCIIGILVFFAYPLIHSLILSFSTYEGLAQFQNIQLTGLDNYVEAFTIDVNFMPNFIIVVRDTFINTPLIIVFSLILAICISKNIRGRGLFRVIFFLPFLLGSGLIYQYLLFSGATQETMEMVRGIVVPSEVGLYFGPTVERILSEFLSRITVALWKSGLQILLFLAALQSIPKSLYESAKCDSANEWEVFWFITVPMLTPIILVNTIYTIIDSFNDINNPLMNYFMLTAFTFMRFDYAAALSWIYFIFVFLVILLVFAGMKRFVYYDVKKTGDKKS